MKIRNGLLWAGIWFACSLSTAHAKTVTLAMDIQIDQVSPEDEKMYRVGGHDLDRIAYDDTQVDPKTKKVKITYLAHYMGGNWASTTPTDTSTLDLSSKPYKLEFAASVNHGRPLVVLFEAATQRMAMLTRPDFRMLIAGKYTIDPAPLTAEQIAAPPPNANSPDTMPMMSGMPRPPGALGGPPPGGLPPSAGPSSPGPTGKLSSSSKYGDLLDNPATKEVLVKLIPEVVTNPQSQMGRGMTLKELSQFEPTITPAKLQEIDAAFSKLP